MVYPWQRHGKSMVKAWIKHGKPWESLFQLHTSLSAGQNHTSCIPTLDLHIYLTYTYVPPWLRLGNSNVTLYLTYTLDYPPLRYIVPFLSAPLHFYLS